MTAVPVVALAVSPHLPILLSAFFVAGISMELFAIAWDQSLQTHEPREVLSRVYSYDMVGSFVAIPLGEALIGPLAHTAGTTATLVGFAILIILASAFAVVVRDVWRVDTGRTSAVAPPPSPS